MTEPTLPPAPDRPKAARPPAAADASGTMRDRLGELARQRARRPLAARVLYALVAAFAVVYGVGVMAGWWGSPVADKVRERRERDARDQPRPPTPPPAMSGDAPR